MDTINCRSTLAYLDPLLNEIFLFLCDPSWRVVVVHVFREANRCADFLVRKGQLASSFELEIVESISPLLGILLADDVRGSVLPR